jgi:hypothetical protein
VAVAAQVAPQGTEFPVNTYTTNVQLRSASCHDSAGNFVVSWDSYQVDGNGYGIAAQRFSSTASPLGTEFVVNTYTTDGQEHPAVCCKPDGTFVIVWDSDGNDGNLDGVFGQRYDSTGAPDGTEFQINTYTMNEQKNPAVCCDSDGDFVVSWPGRLGKLRARW